MAHYEICSCMNSEAMKKFEGILLEVFTLKSNFKFTVSNTDRFKGICAALQDVTCFKFAAKVNS